MKIITCCTFILMIVSLITEAQAASAEAQATLTVVRAISVPETKSLLNNDYQKIETKIYFEESFSYEKKQRVVEVIL